MISGFSAHLNTLYERLPESERAAAAARDGFSDVEMWDAPTGDDAADFLRSLQTFELRLTSVNTPSGDGVNSFGSLGDPASVAQWQEEFAATLAFARAAGARAINVLAGGRLPGLTRDQQQECLAANLSWALDRLTADDPLLLLEPLNAGDRRSPLINRLDDAVAVISALGGPAKLALLFDAYHVAQEESELLACLAAALPHVGHVQIADFPGRGQPGTGRLPLRQLLELLDASDYEGYVGLEYVPHGNVNPLDWVTMAETRQRNELRSR